MNKFDYDRYMVIMSQAHANLQNATLQLKELYDVHEVQTGVEWPVKESVEAHRTHLTYIAKIINEHVRMHEIEMENVQRAYLMQNNNFQKEQESFQRQQAKKEYDRLAQLARDREESEVIRQNEIRREERQKQADERDAVRRNQKPNKNEPEEVKIHLDKKGINKIAKTIEEFANTLCTGRRSCDCCDNYGKYLIDFYNLQDEVEDLGPISEFENLPAKESAARRKKLWLRISKRIHPDKIDDEKFKADFDNLIKGAAKCKEVCNIGGTKPVSATED